MSGSSPATERSFARLIAVEPELSRIAPLAELVPGLPGRTLFHAGPPFADPADLPLPLANGVAAAALHEGWIAGGGELPAALAAGEIRLAPAQDIGLVTPLAFVVGPSVFCLEVRDACAPERRAFSPLNDGPLPDALRLGGGRPAGRAILRELTAAVGPDLAARLAGPLPLLPVIARGLAGGDELHGRLTAAQEAVPGFFGGPLAPASEAYLARASQFVLNVLMAAAALMIGAGAGIAGSDLVVASGGNGRDLGWKLAGEPGRWRTAPATRPVGPRLPGHEASSPLPAIGDSAVLDALGLGAACLRFAPELGAGLRGFVDPAYYGVEAHAAFVGPHPALPFEGLKLGLDLTRTRRCLGIMLGMVGAQGEGLVGRGIAPWPEG
ncbi:Protein of unknown function [Tistlia consotensis]|uniref:DUF1116 domain-containing protein n=1 Tax=Tistlia consotensis USBA 355 TaxID=560819 RepID=A0A1Y6C1P7_9PROT|nr:DUF1116 domain-containing protein [Tistlia consotensis]SMF37176.1 Protein of unknown function [Tistlia consotensis USBA 355]SNR72527.1 Protein of unknown function [Tistlia consotensis]